MVFPLSIFLSFFSLFHSSSLAFTHSTLLFSFVSPYIPFSLHHLIREKKNENEIDEREKIFCFLYTARRVFDDEGPSTSKPITDKESKKKRLWGRREEEVWKGNGRCSPLWDEILRRGGDLGSNDKGTKGDEWMKQNFGIENVVTSTIDRSTRSDDWRSKDELWEWRKRILEEWPN